MKFEDINWDEMDRQTMKQIMEINRKIEILENERESIISQYLDLPVTNCPLNKAKESIRKLRRRN